MPYWRLFYHIAWATKNREPWIRCDFEAELWRVIVGKATEMGALVHAAGGVENHVHVVASVPPSVALSRFIQEMKGSSTHFVNHKLALPQPLSWQAEYGVLSFDGKSLDAMVKYVRNQRSHHTNCTTVPILEKVTAQEQKAEEG